MATLAQSKRVSSSQALNALKPAVKAYTLAYIAVTGPRLLGYLKTILRKDISLQDKLDILLSILKISAQPQRFPAAAGIIIAGATVFPRLVLTTFRLFLSRATRQLSLGLRSAIETCIRHGCTFSSAWLAFRLLNRDEGWARKRARSRAAADSAIPTDLSTQQHPTTTSLEPTEYAGKTIDFTLFVFCRAAEALTINLWTRTRSSSWHPEHRTPSLAKLAKNATDPSIFASSAAIIMWAWFYAPERLPRAYNRWIATAADIDARLIKVLRLCRQGVFVYGQDSGQTPMLTSLCDELGLPQSWADPAKTIPIPCELYHCGTGKSCEVHALSRFAKSWKFAMELYLPLQLLSKIRSWDVSSLIQAVRSAARSSSFLGAFVALFYYSVCLARTRLGPRIFSYKMVSPQTWDAGLCILAGCLTCGWSILLERPNRRQEIAFFVAPRALATLLPRVYDRQYQQREQLCFALGVTSILGMARKNNGHVRGVLGRLLANLLDG